MTEQLVALLSETRDCLHEVLMGVPMTKVRHDRLLDLHDKTREICGGVKIQKAVAPPKVAVAKSGTDYEPAPVGRKMAKDPAIPHDLSIDNAVAWLRDQGITGTRDELRLRVKQYRS